MPLILPADEAFEEARYAFNGMIDRRPAAIARPRSEDEVLAALAYAVDNDLEIAAFGHSKFERLQREKLRRDPANRFRFNSNIPPARA